MTETDRNAGWIWITEEETGPDTKACFRGRLETHAEDESVSLNIWADSRYYLWVDGEFRGTGPRRSWPAHPVHDRYGFPVPAEGKTFQVAILVWHFGTSTSQYIHGSAGLYLSADITGPERPPRQVHADKTWKAAAHNGYRKPVPRINVSQPWLEMVDASRFPSDWMEPEFNDEAWPEALVIDPVQIRVEMPGRDTPMLESREAIPNKVITERLVSCTGIGIRIDYKSAFYPEDRSTEDRYQTGYLATKVVSPEPQPVRITLADRLWPETEEQILLNGKLYTMPPGTRWISADLAAGENLLLLDVSGARQRFTTDCHLNSQYPVEFRPPVSGASSPFYAVGPFDTVDIGNIVCMDGFDDVGPGDVFREVGKARNAGELQAFAEFLHPINNVLFDGVKLRATGASFSSADRIEQDNSALILENRPGRGDTEIVLDMGGEVSGYLHFDVEASVGTQLDFRFAEYAEKGILEIPDDLDTSLRYTCSGKPERLRSLLRRGFRYMAIRMRGSGTVRLGNLVIDEQLYPSPARGNFSSSEEDLDRIWLMCRRTVELCSEDTLVDCPAFEQAYWIGDAYVMGLYRQYLFGDTSLTRHCLRLAARSMERSSLPDCHLPSGVSLVLTTWVQLWILACRTYWTFTADRAFVEEILPWMTQCLEELEKHVGNDGLLDIAAWNMLDWAPMETPYHGIIAHLNAHLVECRRAVADLAEVAGQTGTAQNLRRNADQLAEAVHHAFWDSERQAYRDCIHPGNRLSETFSVQTNLMMLRYNCVPPESSAEVHSFVKNPPDFAVRPGSPFMAHFYYDHLFSVGAGTIALEGILRQWKPMLSQGTCWETFEGFYKDRLTRSYCHGWSASPAYLLGKWVLGVRPLEPGFRKVLIAPTPCGLEKARGTVPLPQGDVRVEWEITGDRFLCRAEIPEGIKWSVEKPEGPWRESEIRVVPVRRFEES